jgi:hypothetical protein
MNDREHRTDERTGRPVSPPPEGGGEVRISRIGRSRRRAFYMALTVLLAAGCIGFFVVRFGSSSESGFASQDSGTQHANDAVPDSIPAARRDDIDARPIAARHSATASAISAQDSSRDLSEFYVPGQPVPTMGEVIDRLHKAGIRSGLGAFSPPGTSPPLSGIAVPDDFPLPQGYVRHFQTTDDGQPIEAILMFSPDFEFFDASGKPIAIPENRVVPPEWAPPELPVRLIEIPRP